MKVYVIQVLAMVFCFILDPCTSTSEVPWKLRHYCPYTNFCTSVARKAYTEIIQLKHLAPCCLPCLCSPQCGIVDRCCPDVEEIYTPSVVYPCKRLQDIRVSYRGAYVTPYRNPFKKHVNLSYHIVDGCPPEALSRPELAEVVSNCYKVTGLEDLTFVTGDESGLTYLNKDCAMCNQDSDNVTQWELVIDYDLAISFLIEFNLSNILSQGKLLIQPPSNDIGLKATCISKSEQITTCNATTEFVRPYSENTEKNCNDIKVPFAHEKDTYIYANVYCFLCNIPADYVYINYNCHLLNYMHTGDAYDKSATGFTASFVAPPPEEEANSVCHSGAVLDPFRMTCRELHCPLGMIAQNGICLQVAHNVKHLVVQIVVGFQFESYVNITTLSARPFTLDFMDFFENSIIRPCRACLLRIYANNRKGIIRGRVITRPPCTVNTISESLSFFLTKALIHLPRSQLNVTLADVKPGWKHGSMPNILFSNFGFLTDCVYTHLDFSSRFINCPTIVLGADDFHEFSGDCNLTNMIISNSLRIDGDHARICLKDYLSIVNETNVILTNLTPTQCNLTPTLYNLTQTHCNLTPTHCMQLFLLITVQVMFLGLTKALQWLW